MPEQTDVEFLRDLARGLGYDGWDDGPTPDRLRAIADRLEAEPETIGWGMANLGERITGHPMYEPDEQGRGAAMHHVQTLNAHEETAHWVVVRVVRND